MSIKDPRLHRTQCSANSLYRMRKSCAQKELQSHGVEDGFDTMSPISQSALCHPQFYPLPPPASPLRTGLVSALG